MPNEMNLSALDVASYDSPIKYWFDTNEGRDLFFYLEDEDGLSRVMTVPFRTAGTLALVLGMSPLFEDVGSMSVIPPDMPVRTEDDS